MTLAIAADTGGTFTDLVAVSSDGHSLVMSKALTDYDDPMVGVMNCVRRAGANLRDAETLKFGTTLVINAFLQRKGAHTALICTEGFRDTLEIRRGNRVVPFDLQYARDSVLVPRHRRYELRERINALGEVQQKLEPSEVETLADKLGELGVEAIAISFLNSYANNQHETLAAEILRAKLPGVYVTIGSDLTREWYEYERSATAAANAYVGPSLDAFLKKMAPTLSAGGFRQSVYLMASNGGVFSIDEARRQPVQLVESGPVGGCIGAAAYARALNLDKVIAFDMGGTTAKCALIEDFEFETRSPYYVGGLERGFPIRGAVVDIVEVGAGGGSIALLDAYQRLTVGPESAGSTPGPACYGRGGRSPTVTDANVVLGRIGERSFLGGEMELDRQAGILAIVEKIGRPLEYIDGDVDRVAQGILDIGVLTMSTAVSQITSERGRDPRDFCLMVFGGGGPVHGGDLARQMGVPRVIVPPNPGVFSAVGMLLAPARIDEAHTFLRPLNSETMILMLREFQQMEARGIQRLPTVLGQDGPTTQRFAELRFKGQRHAHNTFLGTATDVESVRMRFLSSYRRRFGQADENGPIEFVGLSVAMTLPMLTLGPEAITSMRKRTQTTGPARRSVYFGQLGSRVSTEIVHREDLSPGYSHKGPMIVEEYGSSTVVGPHDHIEVGALGELILRIDL